MKRHEERYLAQSTVPDSLLQPLLTAVFPQPGSTTRASNTLNKQIVILFITKHPFSVSSRHWEMLTLQ